MDPYQQAWFNKTGLVNVERAGFSEMVTHYQEPSFLALPRLVAEGRRFDFIFIDGGHRFEQILLDFLYAHRLLRPGCSMMLHDTWMPSTRKALTFVLRNFGAHYRLDPNSLLPPYGMLRGALRALGMMWRSPGEPRVALMLARKHLRNFVVLVKQGEVNEEGYDAAWDFYRSF